jgi:hypothetical protein
LETQNFESQAAAPVVSLPDGSGHKRPRLPSKTNSDVSPPNNREIVNNKAVQPSEQRMGKPTIGEHRKRPATSRQSSFRQWMEIVRNAADTVGAAAPPHPHSRPPVNQSSFDQWMEIARSSATTLATVEPPRPRPQQEGSILRSWLKKRHRDS